MSCEPRINALHFECPETLATAYGLESSQHWSAGELILFCAPADYSPLSLNEGSRYGGAALKVQRTRKGFEASIKTADARVRAILQELATISEYNASGQHIPIRLKDYVAPSWQAIKANLGNANTDPYIQRHGLIPLDLIQDLPVYRGRINRDRPKLADGFKFTFHDLDFT